MEDFFAKLAIDALDSFEEDQRKETWIYSGPASLIVVRKNMLEFYSDQTTHQQLALDVIQVLEISNYFQSCYGKQFLSLFRQHVDGGVFGIYRKHS